jgi:hypothetical protein
MRKSKNRSSPRMTKGTFFCLEFSVFGFAFHRYHLISRLKILAGVYPCEYRDRNDKKYHYPKEYTIKAWDSELV